MGQRMDSFHVQAAALIHDLGRRSANVLAAAKWNGGRPSELARRFRLDRKLAWQICKLAHARGDHLASKYVPSDVGIANFLNAAKSAGASATSINAARAADARLREFQRANAETREQFSVMLDSAQRPERAADEVAVRRSAFRANAAIFGAQIRAQVVTVIVAPQAEGDRTDWLMLSSFFGFQRLRAGVASILGRYSYFVSTVDSIDNQSAGGSYPLEPATAERCHGVPALAKFCSKPLPKLRRDRVTETVVQDVLLPGEVGLAGAVDVVTAEVRPGLGSRWAQSKPDYFHYGARVRNASELLVLDIWHHNDLFKDELKFETFVYATLHDDGATSARPDNLLPMQSEIQRIRGMDDSGIEEAPQYSDVLSYTIRKAGWKPRDFAGYRISQQYPILPSILWARHEIPPP